MEQNQKTGKLLEVKDLHVSFFTPAGEVKAVGGISYDLNYDEVMGIVGESGSGNERGGLLHHRPLQSPVRWWAAPSPWGVRMCWPRARKR